MSKIMKEALDLINSNKIYKKIFKEVHNKFKKYGKITGVFVIKPKCSEDIDVLINFDPRVIYEGKAKIKCTLVEELFTRKLKEASFIELIEKVIGNELETNKEVKEKEKQKLHDFFENVIKKSKNGIGQEWFIYLKDNKTLGYNTVIRKYNECIDINMIDILTKELILVNESLSSLPYINNNKENISVFAAKMTKNPHFFDYDKYTGKLLVHGIKFILKKQSPDGLDELNEMYYDAGLLKDEISNHTTIFGLRAYDKNNKEIIPIKLFGEWNEPLQLSISNLMKINHMKAKDNTVFIFENPSVFGEISKHIKNKVSLICTSGQLNLSSYMIIDKILNLKNIYYAGDFDPEGLLIADKIKLRYKDKVQFLSYDKLTYDKIKSSEQISTSRLSILENIKSKELIEIKKTLQREKRAGYQELLIDEYLKIICK